MKDIALFVKSVLVLTVMALLVYLIAHAAGVVGTVASAPGRVVNKTLGTDNIITSYEWFYDTNAQITARKGQIRAHQKLAVDETDKREKSRLMLEMSAMQQSCRDMTTKYNANSQKANKSLFKSNSLPESFPDNACEVNL